MTKHIGAFHNLGERAEKVCIVSLILAERGGQFLTINFTILS
jgi:hypothetical protein